MWGQFTDLELYNNLGAIFAAPLFFFALLHPFKRESIAKFRWIVLMMWVTGALGMAIFGLSNRSIDPNQLHILFAPIMTAYGLAFLSILWSRLELPATGILMRYGHYVAVVIISSGPLIMSIPSDFRAGVMSTNRAKAVWPAYWPPALNDSLHNGTEETDVVFSDQPWAVAWYSDRISVWLPRKVEEFQDIKVLAEEQGLEVSGIVMSPSSFEDRPLYKPYPFGYNDEFAALMLDGVARGATTGGLRPAGLPMLTPVLAPVMSEFPVAVPLYTNRLTYYTRKSFIRNQ